MKRTVSTLAVVLAVGTLQTHHGSADTGPVLSPCLREGSTLCPVVQAVFDFEEDNDRTRFDAVTGAVAMEPDGYSVARRAGKIGSYALDLTGSDNGYLRIPSISSLGPGWWTVTAWVYPDTVGTSGQKQTILANDFKNQSGTHAYLENVSGSLYLKLSVTTMELDTTLIATSGTPVTAGTWNFVSFGASSFPDIEGQAVIVAQANGGAKGTTALTYYPRAMNTETYIGARVSQSAGSRTPFDGGLDELAFFADALNPLQAQNLLNGGAGIAYPFNDPSYTVVQALAITGDGHYNSMAGSCSSLTSDDGFGSTVYTTSGAGSREIFCTISDPMPGGTYNWVKVWGAFARNGNNWWPQFGVACPDEPNSYGNVGLYTGGTAYNGSGLDVTAYASGIYWEDPGCGYPQSFMWTSVTYTTNPRTGLAWTYEDIVSLELQVLGDANGAYLHATAAYVQVSTNYN